MVFFAPMKKEEQIIEQQDPEAIRYLLIVSFITTNAKLWKENYKNDTFYHESMKIIRDWTTASDTQLKEKYPKLPMKV
jgi:hypothetical protein